MPFDPDAYLGVKSSPKAGSSGFDPDAYLGEDALEVKQADAPKLSQADSPLKTAGKEGLMSAPAGAAGGVAALAAGGALAGAGAGPVGVIAGALVAGFGGSALGQKIFDEVTHMDGVQDLLKNFGLDDKTRQANTKENPKSAFAGSLAGSTLAGGMRPGWSGKGPAALGAGLNTAIEGGQQAVHGEFKPAELAMAAAAGAASKPTKLADRVWKAADLKAAFRKKTSDAKGEKEVIESSDPTKHDLPKKTQLDLEQGFVDPEGNFLTRMEAAKVAKESEVVKEVGRDDEGLHTSDLKGEDSTPKIPESREDHKVRIGEIDSVLMDIEANPKDPRLQSEKPLALKKEREALMKNMPKAEVKDKAAPTSEETHDLLWGAKTYGEVLSRMQEHGVGTQSQKLLAGILGKIGLANEAKVNLRPNEQFPFVYKNGDKGNAPAIYDPVDHSVNLGKGTDLRITLHEGVHAVIDKLMWDNSTPFAQKMTTLYEMHKQNATPEDLKRYGLSENAHEFVTEALTNDSFKFYLKKKEETGAFGVEGKPTSIWNKMKQIIHEEIIGRLRGQAKNEADHEAINQMKMPIKNALDEVLDLSEGLFKEAKDQTFDPDAGVVTIERDVMPSEPRGIKASEALPPEVKEAAKGIHLSSIASEAEFTKHAETIYAVEGKDVALRFFRDWKEHKAKFAIPVPKNKDGLVDTLHKMDTWSTADSSEFRVKHEESTKAGVTKEQREELFRAREGEMPLTPEMKALEEKLLKEGDGEVKALIEKARKLTGDERALREFETGQARYRIMGKNERSWKDFWETKNNPMQDKVAEEATATRERSIFQIEGTDRVIQVIHKDGLDLAYEWKGGKKGGMAIGRAEKISAGDTIRVDGKEVKITDGQVHNIEKHTPYRYLKDAEATQYMKLIELRKMTRDLELIENLKGSDFFGTGRSPETPLGKVPPGYKVPNNIDKIPQLRGWMFDPKTAAIIEDFAKVWDNTLMTKLSGMLIKNMMLNPFPHIMNEVAHLWNLRGLSGWVTPKGVVSLTQTGKDAFMSVSKQDAFYREVMREGGSSLGADPRNNDYFNQIGKDAAKELLEKPQLQGTLEKLNDKMKSLGMGTIDLYNAWLLNSQKAMWFTRDVMYVQAIKEAIKINEKRGTPLTVKQAVDRVEQHMPNYRMPTEVLGSRGFSKMLQNPNIAIFSRYHYGMLKSIANFASELNPKNLKTAEGRQEFKDGVDSLLAAGVAMAMVYPLIDVVVEQIFGEGSKLRRAGGFHVVHSALDVAAGKKDPSSMLWPIFTFNPALLALGQLVANKKLFDGKPIYHADDPAKDIASDVGGYAAKTIPQVSTGLKAEGEGSPRSAVARQFDVQTTTPEKEARISKWEKQKERQKNLRKRKREQGTYKP